MDREAAQEYSPGLASLSNRCKPRVEKRQRNERKGARLTETRRYPETSAFFNAPSRRILPTINLISS
jgi:hypothetical protein